MTREIKAQGTDHMFLVPLAVIHWDSGEMWASDPVPNRVDGDLVDEAVPDRPPRCGFREIRIHHLQSSTRGWRVTAGRLAVAATTQLDPK